MGLTRKNRRAPDGRHRRTARASGVGFGRAGAGGPVAAVGPALVGTARPGRHPAPEEALHRKKRRPGRIPAADEGPAKGRPVARGQAGRAARGAVGRKTRRTARPQPRVTPRPRGTLRAVDVGPYPASPVLRPLRPSSDRPRHSGPSGVACGRSVGSGSRLRLPPPRRPHLRRRHPPRRPPAWPRRPGRRWRAPPSRSPAATSGFSLRKALAFSRPWPMRWPS